MEDETRLYRSSTSDSFIDPEPFSVFLAILGFLGSIASIAGYIDFRRQQRDRIAEERQRLLREARDLLMSLEVDTMQMETSLRKLELVLVEGSLGQRSLPLSNLPLRFGSARPVFTLFGFRQYDEVMVELNRLVGRSFETTSTLLQRLYNLEPVLNREITDRLLDLQNKLNRTLREETTYEEGFRVYYEILAFTKAVLRDMRIQVDRHL